MLVDRRVYLYIKLASAVSSAVVLFATLVFREWIELLFGLGQDEHNGTLEWMIVFALLLATLIFSAMARVEWQRIGVTG